MARGFVISSTPYPDRQLSRLPPFRAGRLARRPLSTMDAPALLAEQRRDGLSFQPVGKKPPTAKLKRVFFFTQVLYWMHWATPLGFPAHVLAAGFGTPGSTRGDIAHPLVIRRALPPCAQGICHLGTFSFFPRALPVLLPATAGFQIADLTPCPDPLTGWALSLAGRTR